MRPRVKNFPAGPSATVSSPMTHTSVLAANQIAFARCGGADRLLRLLDATSLVKDFGSPSAGLPSETDVSATLRLHLQGGRPYLDELGLADACLAVLDFEAASDAVWTTPGRVALAALRLAIAAMACYAVDVCAGREQLAAEGLALLQGEDFIAVVVSCGSPFTF